MGRVVHRERFASRGDFYEGSLHPTRSHEKWRTTWNNNETAKERALNVNLHPRRQVMTYCANFRPGVTRGRAGDSGSSTGTRSGLKSGSFSSAWPDTVTYIEKMPVLLARNAAVWRRCVIPREEHLLIALAPPLAYNLPQNLGFNKRN